MRGYWLVRDGDRLHKIARRFFPDDAQRRRALVDELIATNPTAFAHGNRHAMIAGAKLVLPEYLRPPGVLATGRTRDTVTLPAGPVAAPKAMPSTETPAPPPAATPNGEPRPAKAATRPATEAYRDRLIDESAAGEPDSGEPDPQADQTPGRRALSLGLLQESRDLGRGNRTTSRGITIDYFRETEQYGDILFQGAMGRAEPGILDSTTKRDRFRGTLYHSNFALSRDVAVSTAVGVVRSYLPVWLASSYRASFPTSEMAGLTTVIASAKREVHATIGDLGRSFGSFAPGFERTKGRLSTLGITERFGGGWQAAGTMVSLDGSPVVRDHSGLTLAFGREAGRAGDSLKLQAIVDDDRNLGALFDAQLRADRSMHRVGAYQLEPGLAFGESTGQSDTRGFYLQGEARRGGSVATYGLEYSATNFRRDPLRGGTRSTGANAGLSLRLDRLTQLGGGLSVREERPMAGPGVDRRVSYATAYISRSLPFGTSRLDVSLNDVRPDGFSPETARTYTWNQDWPRIQFIETNSQVSYSDERVSEGRTRRTAASLGLRGPISDTVRWDASFTWVDSDGANSSERNYNAALGLDWQLARSWSLNLQWLRNKVQPTNSDPAITFTRENTVQVTARWSETRGVPYGSYAGAAARSASGRIEGLVFFDENGDGVQQATERGAGGVVLLLNGRFPQTTDRDGRYAFPLVPAGAYRITVLPERVPLPWGLADETPRSVMVGVRQDARLDVGLTRIAP